MEPEVQLHVMIKYTKKQTGNALEGNELSSVNYGLGRMVAARWLLLEPTASRNHTFIVL